MCFTVLPSSWAMMSPRLAPPPLSVPLDTVKFLPVS
jgi:hypothetical protein